MAGSRASERNAQEFYEMKQKAVGFYLENKVPEKLEEVLNNMFFENPPDVFGYLSEYFEKMSKPPVINRVTGREVLDSKGQPTVQADIFCTVKGLEKHMATAVASSFNPYPVNVPLEKKEADERERQEFTNSAVSVINESMSKALDGVDPADQMGADERIVKLMEQLKAEADAREEEERLRRIEEGLKQEAAGGEENKTTAAPPAASPKGKKKAGSARSGGMIVVDEPREPLYPGCAAACAASVAVAGAGAAVTKRQLYEHVSSLAGSKVAEEYTVPMPMVSVLSSGKPALGKQNLIKELMLIPRPGLTVTEGMKQITRIYHQIGKILFSKFGVAAYGVGDTGAFAPQYDRQEQLLDLVQEAGAALELTPAEDFFIALDCAAHEIYEPDKNKYEIMSGLLKTSDDMVEFYADIINRYPAVVALIDPLRKQDSETWSKLCERLSEKCFVIGEHAFPRVERFVREGTGELTVSGVSLRMRQLTTVTDIVQAASLIKEEGAVTVISGVPGDTTQTFLADLAVGVGAKFVKFGAPSRGERTAKYNRLVEISEGLNEQGQLGVFEEFAFPVKKPPTPPPPSEGEQEGGES